MLKLNTKFDFAFFVTIFENCVFENVFAYYSAFFAFYYFYEYILLSVNECINERLGKIFSLNELFLHIINNQIFVVFIF